MPFENNLASQDSWRLQIIKSFRSILKHFNFLMFLWDKEGKKYHLVKILIMICPPEGSTHL